MRRRTYGTEDSWLLSYADLITNLLIFFAMLLAAAHISRTRMQQISRGLSGVDRPASLSAIQDEIDARIESEGLQDLIRTDLTDEGLKLSLNSGVVFDSGHADIRPEFEGILDSMMRTLVPYSGRYGFAVEGHTDTNPIVNGSVHRSNWELSTERANAVRSRLELVGIERRRIRVEGYADTQPLPEEALEGLSRDERLGRHRRVIVRIY
jgi:chemotaxis protein MotB